MGLWYRIKDKAGASPRTRWTGPALTAALLLTTACGEDQGFGRGGGASAGAGDQPGTDDGVSSQGNRNDSDDCRQENICRQGLVCNQGTGNCEVAQPCGGRCRNGELCQKGICVDPAPPVVTIILAGAVILPMKKGGSPWDGLGSVSQQAKDALAAALASINPYASLIRLLDDGTLSALARPDPFGTAEVLGARTAGEELELRKNEGTFRPGWDARWSGVKLDPTKDIRLRVELWDADLMNHDNIGTVSLNVAQLTETLERRAVEHLDVHDQGTGQILFLDVEVFEE